MAHRRLSEVKEEARKPVAISVALTACQFTYKSDAENESMSSRTPPIPTGTGTFNAGLKKYAAKGTEIDRLFAAGAKRPAHSFVEGARRPVAINVAFTACRLHFYDP